MQKFTKFALSLVMVFFAVLAVNAQGTYAVEKGAAALAAGTQITSVPNITMTYGVSGGAEFKAAREFSNWEEATGTYVAFCEGNGENGTATSGTVYYFEPTKNGTLEVAYCLNANKAFFIQEDGTSMEGFDGITVSSKAYKASTINVKAGSKYAVYCKGSKLGFAGFTYTVKEPAGTEDDPIILTAGVAAKGPKAAGAYPYTYTYYKYTATQAGVVSLDTKALGDVMGNIYVGGMGYGYGSTVVVAEGDVVTVKLTAQADATDKTFTLNIRDFAQGESQANAIALAEGANNIAAIANGGLPMWYSMTVPAGKQMTITFDGYPSAKFVVNGEETAIDQNTGYAGTYANNTESDVVAYVQVTALYQACTANVTIADAAPVKPAITALGAVTFSVENGAVLDEAPYFIRMNFPNVKGATDDDIVTVNAYVFEADADGNQTGAPLNISNNEYTSTIADGVAITGIAYEAGKSYIVNVSSVNIRETGDNGHGGKTYAFSYPNAEEHDPITLTFSVKASSAASFDLTGVVMNWKGEQIAAGSEVEALSYAYAIATDKTIAAGEGRIEFKDAQGTGIGVGTLNAEAKTISFKSFGETGYTTPGTYTLVIPAGAIVDAEGNKNNEFTATWTVVGGTHAIDTKIVETEGVYTLSGTWTKLGNGKAYLDTEDNAATITLNEGVATISFTAPTEPGNHYLYVQEKAVVDADGNYNGATSLPIIVEGQNTIVADKYVLTAKVEKCVENIPSEFEEFVGVYKTIATLAGEANALTISENSVRGIFDGFVIKGDAVAYSKDLAIVLKGKKFNVRSLDGISESGMLKLTATENGYTMDGASIWYNGVKVATVDSISIEKFVEKTFAIDSVANAQGAAGSEVEYLSYMFTINAAKPIKGLFEGNITLTDAEGTRVGGNAYVYGYEGEGGATTVYARFTFDTEDYNLHTPGVYTMTIPAGMFVDAEGAKSEAFTATWTIKEQKQTSTFAITAATNAGNAAGSEVEALSYMFEINAANAITGLYEGNITLTDSLGNAVGGNAYVFGYEGEGATTVYARFTFDTEDHNLHTAGAYTLNIPAGMFVDAEGNKSEAYTATWTIKAQPETSTFAITAATNAGNAAGAEVEALSYMFEINAANAITGLYEGNITLTDSLGNAVGGNAYVFGYEGEGATTVYARFTFDTEDHNLHTAGVYTLNIPAGMFVDAEGNKNEAYTATWTIKEQKQTSTFAITAATNAGNAAGSEVEALSYMFEINAANAITGLFEGNITLTDSLGNKVGGNATVVGYEGDGGATTVYARFTFDTEDHNLHTAGAYTLNIPAGMFVDAEGNKSEAYTATWTIKAQPETSTFAITAATNAGNAAGSEVEALSYMFEINAANAITGLFEGNITLTDSLGNKVGGNATVVGYEGDGGATTVYARFAFDTEDHNLHTAGVYTLNIPAGMFVDAEGNKSEAYTATWTIKEQKQTSTFAITAATNAGNAAGSEVEALSYMFEINAANAITGLFEGNITLTDSLGNKVGGNATVVGYEGEGGATTVYARFAFDTEDHMLHTAGVYTLNIPAGMFVDAEGNKSEAFTATWTIKAQPETSTFAIESVTNAAGEGEVEALSYMFTINAANAITGLFEGNITLTDSIGNPVGGYATVMGYEGEGGAKTVYAKFTFDTEDHMLHTAGVYTLNIPAGMFVDAEGNKSEAFTASWTVVPAAHAIDTKIVKSEEGVYTLTGTWATLGTGIAYLDTEDNVATITLDENGVATISFTAPTEPGNHYLYVQENAVVNAEGNFNGATSIVIIVEDPTTGIKNVTNAPKANGKYLMNGKIVIVKDNVKYNVSGSMIK